MAPSDDEEYLTSGESDGGDYDYEEAPRRRTRRLEPHRGTLILVLGILGLVVCPITGIFAWVMGNEDMKKIRAGRMDPEGEGITQAGRIMGIIASALMIIGILLMGLGMCAAVFTAGSSTDIDFEQYEPPR